MLAFVFAREDLTIPGLASSRVVLLLVTRDARVLLGETRNGSSTRGVDDGGDTIGEDGGSTSDEGGNTSEGGGSTGEDGGASITGDEPKPSRLELASLVLPGFEDVCAFVARLIANGGGLAGGGKKGDASLVLEDERIGDGGGKVALGEGKPWDIEGAGNT